MQLKDDFNTNSLCIQRFLFSAAQEVKESLPHPFGALEKAKYYLRAGGLPEPIYFFTTTVHDEAESVKYLKKYFMEKVQIPKWCSIDKVVAGETKTIYHGNPGIDEKRIWENTAQA